MELGIVRPIRVEEEMKSSYVDYAMSVITSRALPDVRDGLKPAQRRILVAMHDLNLTPGSHYRKCAKICGDTSGNYHPTARRSSTPPWCAWPRTSTCATRWWMGRVTSVQLTTIRLRRCAIV